MPQYTPTGKQPQIQNRQANLVRAGGADIQSLGAELGLVVDRSGSMEPIQDQIVTSFNTLLDEQKHGNKDLVRAGGAVSTTFSLALFNNSVRTVYDAVPIVDVPELTRAVYEPAGGTALNDAIGSMIQSIGKRAGRNTRVMIAVLTDGAENSSNRFSTADILQMVSYRRLNYDWQFIFIGPPCSIDYGLKIGIQRSNIVEFDADPAGIQLIMNRLSKSVRAYQLGDRKYALKLRN
jgi:hypothetical protein